MDFSDNAKDAPVFGLSFSGRSISGIVGYLENEKFTVKAALTLKTEGLFSDGKITDSKKASEAISLLKEKLEQKCGFHINDVCASAFGHSLKTVDITSKISFTNEVTVSEEHLSRLYQKCTEDAYRKISNIGEYGQKYYCVGKYTVKYFINDLYESEPTGKRARELSAEMSATFLPFNAVNDVVKAVNEAGLLIRNLSVEPAAIYEATVFGKLRDMYTALVDIKDDSTDIYVMNNGFILSAGNVSGAYNSFVKVISDYCMTESQEAEKILNSLDEKAEIEFEDVLGFSKKIKLSEVLEMLESQAKNIKKRISEKIKELNGGENADAVFLSAEGVMRELFENTEKDLSLSFKHMTLSDLDVLGKIRIKGEIPDADSFPVSAAGVCLNCFSQNNSFINVMLNDERIMIYDYGYTTVFDAAMQIGLDSNALYKRRGDSLEFTFNKEKITLNGEAGEPSQVFLNGKASDLNEVLYANDLIKLVPSTKGNKGIVTVGKLKEKCKKINIRVNKMNFALPVELSVNGSVCKDSYVIQNGDNAETLDYLTVGQVLELVDLNLKEGQAIIVNNIPADIETKLYSDYSLDIV